MAIPGPVKPGDRLDYRDENEIRAFLANMLRSSGANFCVDSTGIHIRGLSNPPGSQLPAGADGQVPEYASTEPTGFLPIYPALGMTIVSIHNNYLVCTDFASTSYNVARPPLNMRNSPEGTTGRDGHTISYTGAQTRTVDGNAQTIGPTPYAAGDVVVAVKCNLQTLDDSGSALACRYVSTDARVWSQA